MKLVDVDCDDARLSRLLHLYIHEWSALLPAFAMPNVDGLFVYPSLDAWREQTRHRAALFLDDTTGAPIGFAMTVRDERDVTHVEEFFVVAGLRRRGIGARAALALFAGAKAWTLTVRPENPRALSFWRSVTSSFRDRRESVEVGEDGVARTRIAFAVSSGA